MTARTARESSMELLTSVSISGTQSIVCTQSPCACTVHYSGSSGISETKPHGFHRLGICV